MDPSVKRSAVTPSKSRVARAFAKVFHVQLDDGIKKTKSHEKMKKEDPLRREELQEKVVREAFLAKLFATVSSVKSSYAQLQCAQSPYDPDAIQSADQTIVSELKKLSELKQCYLNKQLNEMSPEKTLIQSEIVEQKSLLKTYEVTSKKLDSQLKLKDSEITFLKEKLEEIRRENKSLEKRLNSSGQLTVPENTKLSDLNPTHFVSYFRHVLKSIRSFVRLLITEMEASGWDLEAAAQSIAPGVSFLKPNHKCLAFESFVCSVMFDGFNSPDFSIQTDKEKQKSFFFARFLELKSTSASDYLAWKQKSSFKTFCCAKYLKLVHPKMEEALFGNLSQRDLVSSGDYVPETPFFSAYAEMAKRVWVLHCLALSFDHEVSIFRVGKGIRFSEVYMESLSDEAFFSPEASLASDPRVGFCVVPGFRIGKTVIQCQVYLC